MKNEFKNGKKKTMKYLLLFCSDAQDLATWQELSEDERDQKRVQASRWILDHRSQIRKSNGLHLPYTVTSVHVGSGGQPPRGRWPIS